MKSILHTLYLIPAALLVACGTTSTAPSERIYVQVYASTGAVQCDASGVRVADMAQQMRDQGVRVEMASCGHDGMARSAVCGAPDGSIGVFVIPQSDYQRALGLGFQPFDRLPEARVQPCPEQLQQPAGSPDPSARN